KEFIRLKDIQTNGIRYDSRCLLFRSTNIQNHGLVVILEQFSPFLLRDIFHNYSLSNSKRWPATTSLSLPFWYTSCPLTKVWVIFDLKLVPSNGDHPHLYRIFSFFTFQGW